MTATVANNTYDITARLVFTCPHCGYISSRGIYINGLIPPIPKERCENCDKVFERLVFEKEIETP